MKKSFVLVVFCLAFCAMGWTQSTSSQPQSASSSMKSMSLPKIIWIYREEVKPARGALHEKVETAYSRLWEKAQVAPYWGLDSVSGDDESVFISGYDSFADAEKDFKAFSDVSNGPLKDDYTALATQEAGLINGVRSSLAVFRPELSYLSDRFMDQLPKSRYVQIESFQVRFGKDSSFAEGAKLYQEAYRQLNIQEPWCVYQVISGAPVGTYLVFSSMDSLGDVDRHMAMEPRIHEAMGERMQDMMKSAGDYLSMQTIFYRLNPKTSYVSKEFAAADPSYWAKPPITGGANVLARTDYASDPAIIRRMQLALNSLGYSVGTPDGVIGPQTRSALERFQKDHGLPATGKCDQETSEKLGM